MSFGTCLPRRGACGAVASQATGADEGQPMMSLSEWSAKPYWTSTEAGCYTAETSSTLSAPASTIPCA
jgi:hypothetical protein